MAGRTFIMLGVSQDLHERFMELSFPAKKAIRNQLIETLDQMVDAKLDERAAFYQKRATRGKAGAQHPPAPQAAPVSKQESATASPAPAQAAEPHPVTTAAPVQPQAPSAPALEGVGAFVPVPYERPKEDEPNDSQRDQSGSTQPMPTLDSIGLDMSSWG